MKEITFLHKNKHRWARFENAFLKGAKIHTDELADLYIQLTDDLSYAKTYYPRSKTAIYLNSLSVAAHQVIYKNKKEKGNRIFMFYRYEFPLVMKMAQKPLLYSFLIFFISVMIGWFSTLYDDTFVRTVLGDSYVNQTIENIEKGDPMAIYKSMNEADMFLGITFNNIKVSFMVFMFGIFTAFGTGYILFSNGLMLGSFLAFFNTRELLSVCLKTLWIHGTLEIAAIIVAGAAGIIVGNSFIFTGTYPRKTSFARGVKKGAKMVVGIFPVFIVAGLLEGFVTRYTQMPLSLSLFIIFSSLIFVGWYFILYPGKIFLKQQIHGKTEN